MTSNVIRQSPSADAAQKPDWRAERQQLCETEKQRLDDSRAKEEAERAAFRERQQVESEFSMAVAYDYEIRQDLSRAILKDIHATLKDAGYESTAKELFRQLLGHGEIEGTPYRLALDQSGFVRLLRGDGVPKRLIDRTIKRLEEAADILHPQHRPEDIWAARVRSFQQFVSRVRCLGLLQHFDRLPEGFGSNFLIAVRDGATSSELKAMFDAPTYDQLRSLDQKLFSLFWPVKNDVRQQSAARIAEIERETSDCADKSNGQSDTLKKSGRKTKRRELDAHCWACIDEFKLARKRRDPQPMSEIVREYVREHSEVKESSLTKALYDNSDQWKPKPRTAK